MVLGSKHIYHLELQSRDNFNLLFEKVVISSKLRNLQFNKNKTGGLGWWFGVGGKAMFFGRTVRLLVQI